MRKILAFGASNSKNSINKALAHYAADQISDVKAIKIDLNDYEMPLYSIDREKEQGFPEKAHEFKTLVNECDGMIISFAEHNGSYTAAFKNIYDWISRFGKPIWSEKPALLMGTSPGGRGAKSVLEFAMSNLPRRGVKISSHFSLPSFKENFDKVGGILDPELNAEFRNALDAFIEGLE